jgi:hypothetical protein
MRFKYNLYSLIFFILLFGCSHGESGIDIILANDEHLEDTIAGTWIRIFNLSYDNNSRSITNRIYDKFTKDNLLINQQPTQIDSALTAVQAALIDEYIEDNDSITSVWEIYYKSPEYPFAEKDSLVVYVTLTEGMQPWITLKLSPPGLPWFIVIPDHHEMLKPNRKFEHAVTITSKADHGARLFLFGWGKYCTKIELF